MALNSCINIIFLILICILFIIGSCEGGIFSWIFKGYDNDNIEQEPNYMEILETEFKIHDKGHGSDIAISTKIPFEISPPEQKFLDEASSFTSIELSELDKCHHKIILGLKKKCSELSEEELAKVSVNLLNCQSLAEGRKIYPCTSNMAIHECTKVMDSDTWNAYHIVSNRARAVCYQFRQQQFRFKTEMTVSKLMTSAEGQINTMKELEESHNNLKEVTSDTLNSLSMGQSELQKKQGELFSAHSLIHNYISSNLKDLSRERKLIASGQKELSQITMLIKEKLERAHVQLEDQGEGQKLFNEQIIKDLSTVQSSANQIWHELDQSIQKIITINEQTASRNSQLLKDLDKMNATVHHLLGIVNVMKIRLEEKFSWISGMLGDTDETVQKIYSFSIHLSYLLSAVVIASFLQVPYVTRVALMVSVPLNAMSEMKSGQSLQFSTLTAILVMCMLFNVGGKALAVKYSKRKTYIGSSGSICSIGNSTSQISSDDSQKFKSPSSTNNSRTSLGDYSSEEENSPKKREFNLTKPSDWYRQIRNAKPVNPSKPDSNADNKNILEENGFPLTNGLDHQSVSDGIKPEKIGISDIQGVRRHLLHQINEATTDSSSAFTPRQLGSLNDSGRKHRSRSSTPVDGRSPSRLTPSSKQLCTSICKSGFLCKNIVSGNSGMCYRHLNGSRESTPRI